MKSLRMMKTCTCDRTRPETFDPACPEHGEGTLNYRRLQALNRGNFTEYERLLLESARSATPESENTDG